MTLPVRGPETASMTTRDGTRLDADVWRPEGPGQFPVLLMRQPYGRRIASTLVYAHPGWYAAQGYIVVIQDVRGTGSSEGRFRLFLDEEADGAQAVRWAASLPGASGRIGMYGFSYQAVTQFLALAGGAELHALAPAMAGWDMRSDWAWEGGAFAFAAGLGWGAQMGWIKACHDGDTQAAAAFQAMARALPLQTADRAMPAAMHRHAGLSHYADWISHPEPGDHWDAFAPRARLAGKAVTVPMLHIGGWYDQMLMGTLDSHQALSIDAPGQALVVGPWTHQPWGRRVGAVDFGAAASSPIDGMQVAFFDRHLKGIGDLPPPLRLFDLGTRAWTEAAAWPPAQTSSWYLGGTGLACRHHDRRNAAAGLRVRRDRAVGARPLAPRAVPRRPQCPAGRHAGPRRSGRPRRRRLLHLHAPRVAAGDLRACGGGAVGCGGPEQLRCVGRAGDGGPAGPELEPDPGPCPLRPPGCGAVPGGDAGDDDDGARGTCAAPVPCGDQLSRLRCQSRHGGRARRPRAQEEERVIVMTLRHGGAAPSRLLLPVCRAGQG